jgi:uncharacterized tellurite resistance protein B-like protein
MVMRRLLGKPEENPGPISAPERETETVRRIASELAQLEPEQRRFLAGFAYLLSRAAHADLDISDDEVRLMERVVTEIGKLPEAQAVLVVQIAKHQTELYSGTEDYLVTREFAARASEEQRRAVMEACFAVVAVDHQITAVEFAELTEISDELGLTRPELNEIRAKYRDQLSVLQQMRGLNAG